MAFSRSTNFAFSQIAIRFVSYIAPVQVGDRVGVKLNVNGTEQDVVLIGIEAPTADAPGFVVKLTGGAYLSDVQIRDNFARTIAGLLIPPFPERDKLTVSKLTFSGGVPAVQIKYTGNIYTVIDSLVSDSYGVELAGVSHDYDSGVNGFRLNQANDKATTFVIKQNVKGGYTPFRNDVNVGAPSFARDTNGDIVTDFLPPFARYSPADFATSKKITTYDIKNKTKVLLSPPFDAQTLPNIPRPALNSVSISKASPTLFEVTASPTWDIANLLYDTANVYYPDLLFDLNDGDFQPESSFFVETGTYTINVRDEVGYQTSYTFDVTEAAAAKPEPFIQVQVTNPLRFIDQAPQKFKRDDNTLFNKYFIKNVQHQYFRQPFELGTLIQTQFKSNYDNHLLTVKNCAGEVVETLQPVLKINNLNQKDFRDCQVKQATEGIGLIFFPGGNIYDTTTFDAIDTYKSVGGRLPEFARVGMQCEISSTPQRAETNITVNSPCVLDDILTLQVGATTYRFICGYEDDPAYPEYAGYDGYFIPGAGAAYVFQVLNLKIQTYEPNYACTLSGDTIRIRANAIGSAYSVRVTAKSGNFGETFLTGTNGAINNVFEVTNIIYDVAAKAWACEIALTWAEGAINAKCFSSYNLETFNILEVSYIAGNKGQYFFELTASDDDPRYTTKLFESEPIIIDQFDNCVAINYRSADNMSEIDYRTGIAFTMFVPGRFDRYNPASEDDSTINDSGDVRLMKSIYQRIMTFESNPVPAWLIEKIIIATGQSEVELNGLPVSRTDKPGIESLIEQNNPFYTLTADFNVNKNVSVTQSVGIVSESVGILGASDEIVIGV